MGNAIGRPRRGDARFDHVDERGQIDDRALQIGTHRAGQQDG
jgi:hypothetical protein